MYRCHAVEKMTRNSIALMRDGSVMADSDLVDFLSGPTDSAINFNGSADLHTLFTPLLQRWDGKTTPIAQIQEGRPSLWVVEAKKQNSAHRYTKTCYWASWGITFPDFRVSELTLASCLYCIGMNFMSVVIYTCVRTMLLVDYLACGAWEYLNTTNERRVHVKKRPAMTLKW